MAKVAIVFEDNLETNGINVELMTDRPEDCQDEETAAERAAAGLWNVISDLIQEAQKEE